MSTTPTIPDGVLELAELERRGWAERGLALARSGAPLNDRTLVESVRTVDDTLKGLRQDAGEKWTAKQTAEKAVADAIAAGQSVTPGSELFVAMDEAGKAYGELADGITAQETVKARLIEALGQEGVDLGGEGSEGRDDYVAELRELRGELFGANGRRQSAGERITQSDRWKQAVADGELGRRKIGDVALGQGLSRDELKAELITGVDSGSAGAFVTPDRQGYYPLPLRPLTILDLITIGQTDSDLVEFVRMLSLTNAAAETAEALSSAPVDGTTVTAVQGGVKPESGMAFEVVQEAVSTIAHWVPATKRALSDAGQLLTIIDGALRWGLGDRLERQVVNGNGVGENLLGLLQQTGMNAIPAGPKSHADKIHNGITQNRLDGFASTGVILNPLDAETIWLSRENTGGAGTGGYLFGAPNNPGPRTLWGLPVAESPAMPQGTAIVGALQAAILWLREGTQVLASDSHEDFFTRNLVAVLAEMRAGFGVPTPAAFAEVNLAAA